MMERTLWCIRVHPPHPKNPNANQELPIPLGCCLRGIHCNRQWRFGVSFRPHETNEPGFMLRCFHPLPFSHILFLTWSCWERHFGQLYVKFKMAQEMKLLDKHLVTVDLCSNSNDLFWEHWPNLCIWLLTTFVAESMIQYTRLESLGCHEIIWILLTSVGFSYWSHQPNRRRRRDRSSARDSKVLPFQKHYGRAEVFTLRSQSAPWPAEVTFIFTKTWSILLLLGNSLSLTGYGWPAWNESLGEAWWTGNGNDFGGVRVPCYCLWVCVRAQATCKKINSPSPNCRVMWRRKIVLTHQKQVSVSSRSTSISPFSPEQASNGICPEGHWMHQALFIMSPHSCRGLVYIQGIRHAQEIWQVWEVSNARETSKVWVLIPISHGIKTYTTSEPPSALTHSRPIIGIQWGHPQWLMLAQHTKSKQLLASISEPIWFTWCLWVYPHKKQRIYKHISCIIYILIAKNGKNNYLLSTNC